MSGGAIVLISENKLFAKSFAYALKEISDVKVFNKVPTVLSRETQIVFCDEGFYSEIKRVSTSIHVVALSFFESSPQITKYPHYYLIDRNSDFSAVTSVIVRKLNQFGFYKSICFTTNDATSILSGQLDIIVVPKHIAKVKPQKEIVKPALITAPVASKKRTFKHKQAAFLVGLFLAWIMLLPVASLGVATGVFYASVSQIKSNNLKAAVPLLNLSNQVALLSIKSAAPLTLIPVVGKPYIFFTQIASLEAKAAPTLIKAINIADEIYKNPTIAQLKDNSSSVDSLSREMLGLLADGKSIPFLKNVYPDIFAREDLPDYILLVNELFKMSTIPNIQPKDVLVLLQNNMEIRPTGGFIGSFALLKLDDNLLSNYQIYDVYDADGQLNGYISPPEPIQKYLRESSWKMRDSNWDPDFSVSGERASWFLDKTLNRDALLVVGLNLEVLRSVLSIIGPVNVIDYNAKIDASNFYSKIQEEVHKDFFPGTRKKSNFLTAVAKSVLLTVKERKGDWMQIIAKLAPLLKSHDILLYAKNGRLQSAIVDADLGGVVNANAIGFIEANLGVNKANQFITRKGSVYYDKNFKLLSQTIVIQNNAPVVSDETRYRVYLRSIAPSTFSYKTAKITQGSLERTVAADVTKVGGRGEAGVFFEVNAGSSATVIFEWEGLDNLSLDSLTYWKQAGVNSYPLSVDLSLTEGMRKQYNTKTDHNLEIEI